MEVNMPTKYEVDAWTAKMSAFRAKLHNLSKDVTDEHVEELDGELQSITDEAQNWYRDA
jgi:hypothetical protein